MPAAFRLIQLPQRRDQRGLLLFGQINEQLPYPVRRFFMLSEVGEGVSRGGHAHRLQHQYLMMVKGSVVVTIDDGATKARVPLDRPDMALHAPPMLWLDLEEFSDGSVCLVLASDVYDESDYIRDYGEFRRLTGAR